MLDKMSRGVDRRADRRRQLAERCARCRRQKRGTRGTSCDRRGHVGHRWLRPRPREDGEEDGLLVGEMQRILRWETGRLRASLGGTRGRRRRRRVSMGTACGLMGESTFPGCTSRLTKREKHARNHSAARMFNCLALRLSNRIWRESSPASFHIYPLSALPLCPSTFPSSPLSHRHFLHDPHALTSSPRPGTTPMMTPNAPHDRTLLALTAITTDFPVSGPDALYPPKRHDAMHPSPIITGTYGRSCSTPRLHMAFLSILLPSPFHAHSYIYAHRASYPHLHRHHP